MGLATDYAPTEAFSSLVDRLAEGGPIARALDADAPPPPTGPLVAERGLIDDAFAAESVADILGRLDVAASAGSTFAAETAALMRTRCPTSLCIAREQMRRGPALDFADAVLTEYRLVTRLMHGHDFFEGVRAVLIDKDGRPEWRPATLDAVDHAAVLAAFGPTEGSEPRFA